MNADSKLKEIRRFAPYFHKEDVKKAINDAIQQGRADVYEMFDRGVDKWLELINDCIDKGAPAECIAALKRNALAYEHALRSMDYHNRCGWNA